MSQEDFLDVNQKQIYIVNMTKFILNSSQTKIPIKKAAIVKHVLNNNVKLFKEIFSAARQKLSDIYGFSIHELDTKSAQYICVSDFATGSTSSYNNSEKKQIALLFVIVSFIFMKGGVVEEFKLWDFLKLLNIHLDENHHFFGNVKKLLELFTKQFYIRREKDNSTRGAEDNKFSYSLGYRSLLEFPKKKLLDSVAKILKKPVTTFHHQYQLVLEEEGNMRGLHNAHIDQNDSSD